MAGRQATRRLAAIVSADVVGYSRLMGEDETATLGAMKAHRRELWTPNIEGHDGRVVGTAGDSILVEFQSAVAAIECSVAIQRGMAERNVSLPEGRQMLLRVGVNIGEVVVEGGDIFGDAVNVAARLEALAEPGGICASDDVVRQLRGKLDLVFTDGGLKEVKNIAAPIHVWPSLPT
jgi:adenylate cyclase